MRRPRWGDCSSSYPSGNQVDGLPLVAMKSNTKTVGKKKEQGPAHAGALYHVKLEMIRRAGDSLQVESYTKQQIEEQEILSK